MAGRQNLTTEDLAAIAAVSARGGAQELYRTADALIQRVIGHNLFTIMRVHEAAQEVERLYSSNTAAYPVGGRKQKKDTHWGRVVLEEGAVFVARSPADVKRAFADHELIFSLGIGSIMNVPIGFGGRRLGTMNVSNKANWFTPEDETKGRIVAALLVPALLSA